MKELEYDKIVIHNLDKIPEGLKYMDGYGVSELGDYDWKELSGLGIDEVWYWYATASYEGSGKMILRKGDLYDIWDLGHCSCYGALDRQGQPNWKKLADIKTSEEFDEEVKELMDSLK